MIIVYVYLGWAVHECSRLLAYAPPGRSRAGGLEKLVYVADAGRNQSQNNVDIVVIVTDSIQPQPSLFLQRPNNIFPNLSGWLGTA